MSITNSDDPLLMDQPRPKWFDYSVAIAAVAAATLLRLALDPILGDSYPFIISYGAVAAVAWRGQTWPAALTLTGSGILALYLFIPPRYSIVTTEPRDVIGLVLFFAIGVVIVAMGHAILKGRRSTECLLAEALVRSEELRQAVVTEAEQRERLRITLDSIGDAVITTDQASRVISLNPVAEALTGWTTSEAAGVLLSEVFHIVNEETRQPVENPALLAIKEGFIVGLTNQSILIAKDGTERPIDDSTAPIQDKDGEIVGCVLVFRDISERKADQQALATSEARLRRVFESNVVGMIQWDLDRSLIVDANATFLRMTGYTRDDVAAGRLNFRDMTPAEWTPRNEEGICHIRAEGHAAPYEKEYFRKDGSRVPLIIAGTRFEDSPSEGMSLIIDISDRIRAEREVVRIAAESERQRRLYETVLSNTPDFVYVFSLDHRVLYANDALIKMWGRGYDGAIGKTFLEIGYEPWHAEMHDREIDQVRATRQAIRGEVPFTGTYGTRQYDYIFVPVIGADGEVEAVAGTTRDVTERNETVERLRVSEERQAFLIRLADTLRPLSDPSDVQAEASRVLGEFLGANRVAYFEIRGDEYVVERDYTAGLESLVGRYPVAAFGAALLANLLDGRTVIEADATAEPDRPLKEREAFATIQVRGHVDVPLVKGSRFVAGMTVHVSERRDWTSQEIVLIEDTAERTWAAVERVRAEDEIARIAAEAERERRLFAAVLSNTPDFIYTFDVEGRFVYVNAALLDLWGKRLDEAVGRNFFDLGYPPALAERLQRQIQQVIDTKRPLRDEAHYTSDQGERMYEYILAPVVGADKAVEAVAGSSRDITSRKQAEEERERLVGQLRDADRRKDEFLATLAHELRNPLAPIRNGLQIIRLAGATGTVEQARTMMERQLGQMVRLVDDLLDVSRITTAKLELRRERLELRTVIDAALETTRPVIEQSGHDLLVLMPEEPIFVEGDLIRLAQVISNLLTNSAKYTHHGGHICLKLVSDGSVVAISVSDDGIGIPPAMLDRIFEMFIQVDRTLEKSTGGLGIGLSLVKGLIELHGGTIEAKSESEGRGSEFVVRLPVVKPNAASESLTEGKDAQVAPSGSRRILVVDDNADAANSLAKLLELLGNEVRTSYDGESGVTAAGEFLPSVVLCDIGMPRVNGYDAARLIRAEPWGRDMVLVALTGWGQEDDRKKSTDAGFDHHLVKPVEPATLLKFLAGLIPGRP